MNDTCSESAPRWWLDKAAEKLRKKRDAFAEILRKGNFRVACSMLVMGSGQMMYKQWCKGILYLLLQAGFIVYLLMAGAKDLFGLFTLGSVEANPWYGIKGDNSVLMMLTGILSVIVIVLYLSLYAGNVKRVYETQKRVDAGKKPFIFFEDVRQFFDQKFYRTVLFFPVIGVCIFNVLPSCS